MYYLTILFVYKLYEANNTKLIISMTRLVSISTTYKKKIWYIILYVANFVALKRRRVNELQAYNKNTQTKTKRRITRMGCVSKL